jgi:hypothetical protein
MTVQTEIPGRDASCGAANRTSGTVPQTGNAVIIAEDRQQHDYREQIILGGPGSGSEVTPLGRAGAGSWHKKGCYGATASR